MAIVHVKIDNYERLARKAAAKNTTVDHLVEPVLDQLAEIESSSEDKRAAFDEWMSLVKKRSHRYSPDFLVDDSRESIYADRGE